VQAYNLL